MSAKANHFKIGVFILSALIIVIVAIVVLSGGRWFNQHRVHWESYFDESVQGLAVGAPIKYRGVQVGKVDSIGFVGNEYGSALSKEDLLRYGRYVVVAGSGSPIAMHLTEEEQKATRASNIVAGLRVRLASQGVTGVVYLDADYLDPKEYPVMNVPWTPQVEYVPSAPSTVTVLGAALHNIARDLEQADLHKITGDLDRLLLDVTKFVNDTNLQRLSREAGQALSELQETARQVRGLVESHEFKTMMVDAAATVKETQHLLGNVSEASKQLMRWSESIPDTLNRVNRSAHRVDMLISTKHEDLAETLENLRVVSENLREVTEDAKRYPAHVFFGDPPPHAGTAKR
jgi:ABC-type transporter Mla subunit MlaD